MSTDLTFTINDLDVTVSLSNEINVELSGIMFEKIFNILETKFPGKKISTTDGKLLDGVDKKREIIEILMYEFCESQLNNGNIFMPNCLNGMIDVLLDAFEIPYSDNRFEQYDWSDFKKETCNLFNYILNNM